uniref:Uncharacterized protein n=1 Tax=Arundo donax TaxID=35708 RepID=A0A0A9EPA6_ARUDO
MNPISLLGNKAKICSKTSMIKPITDQDSKINKQDKQSDKKLWMAEENKVEQGDGVVKSTNQWISTCDIALKCKQCSRQVFCSSLIVQY